MVRIQRPDQVHKIFFINFCYTLTFAFFVINFYLLLSDAGGAPYPTMTNTEICGALKNGYRMERPAMCCDEV